MRQHSLLVYDTPLRTKIVKGPKVSEKHHKNINNKYIKSVNGYH